jgi:hypothetical protein
MTYLSSGIDRSAQIALTENFPNKLAITIPPMQTPAPIS